MKRLVVLVVVALMAGLGVVAVTGPAQAAAQVTIDPSDPRLVPNPIETSDPGTVWTCRATGTQVQCNGVFEDSWALAEGPGDWCSVPLFSVDGSFVRKQIRYYQYDATTGQYLEYKRLIHLDSNELFTPDPDATEVVIARLSMTWVSTFQTPGDPDSRITRKQGIDTLIKPPNGGLVVLDVGQKTEDLVIAPGEDFNFHGRWDIALGDPAAAFGKVCTALGL